MKKSLFIAIALCLVLTGCARPSDDTPPAQAADPVVQEPVISECPYEYISFRARFHESGPERFLTSEETLQTVWEKLSWDTLVETEEEGTTGELENPFTFTFNNPGGKTISIYLNSVVEIKDKYDGRVRRYKAANTVQEIEMILMDAAAQSLYTVSPTAVNVLLEAQNISVIKAGQDNWTYDITAQDLEGLKQTLNFETWTPFAMEDGTLPPYQYSVRGGMQRELTIYQAEGFIALTDNGFTGYFTIDAEQLQAICDELEKLC